MIEEYEDFSRHVAFGRGGILAAWFVAELTGPVAHGIGYLDRVGRRDMFYARMHWSGFTALRLGEVRQDLGSQDPAWGDHLLCEMVRLGNVEMKALPADYRFFEYLPSVVVMNDNPAVARAFADLVTCFTSGRDWSRELYHVNWHGYRFYAKERWERREDVEIVQEVWLPDDERIEQIEQHEHGYRYRLGFGVSPMPDLPPTLTSRVLVQQWLNTITAPYYKERALHEAAKMWVGAAEHVGREAWTRREAKTGVIGFDALAEFFKRYAFPLWPIELNEFDLMWDLVINGRG